MKSLKTRIYEALKVNASSPFKEKVKMPLSDWDNWKNENKTTVRDLTVYEDIENGLFYVYGQNGQHLAMYKIDDQMLMCDDKSLFGVS